MAGARPMDSYSRMVAFFKVLLPLAALAILATLFLLSRGVEFNAAIPFAESEIAGRLRDQQVTGPFFSGTTSNGDEIMVNATLARPGGTDRPAEATDVSAQLKTAAGGGMTLESDLVQVLAREDLARFSGDVRIVTSTGIDVRTDQLDTALTGLSGKAPGTLSGTSPFGDLTSGSMEFSAKNEGGPLHVLFKSGVKLVYRPAENPE